MNLEIGKFYMTRDRLTIVMISDINQQNYDYPYEGSIVDTILDDLITSSCYYFTSDGFYLTYSVYFMDLIKEIKL